MTTKHSIHRDTVEHITASQNEPSWMTDLRESAMSFYETVSHQAPRTISLKEIQAFVEPPKASVPSRDWPRDLKYAIEERGDEEGLIVQRDSTILSRSITKDQTKKGVIFTDLGTALRLHPGLVSRYFAQLVKPEELFSALNTAFWSGGTFLYVPEHVQIALPFHTCYWMTTPGAAIFPRTVIVAEKGSVVTLVDDFLSAGWEKPSLAVSVVELFVQEKAHVTYKQLHHWGQGVHHENRQMSSVAFGGKLETSQLSDIRPMHTLERVAELYPEVKVDYDRS